jgi:small subunit ribosomal protein S17
MARKLTGTVTSDIQDKTIVVTVTTRKTHPIYGKSYLQTKKFAAHDEKNEAKIGDKVIIAESKPISRNKSFILDTIVERGHEAIEIKKTTVEEEAEAKLAEKEAHATAKKEAEKVAEEVKSDKKEAAK